MANVKTKWVCQSCGYEAPKYMGKCPECSSWGSFVEETVLPENTKSVKSQSHTDIVEVCKISDVVADKTVRLSTGFEEFDRVLGGGTVAGSVILIAGDPGIGKSTIVLQTAGAIAKSDKKVLYVCAEESAAQVKLRAERLKVNSENIFIYSQTDIDNIKLQIEKIEPDFLIIDSIQAVYDNNISSGAGSVSQIRECTNVLTDIAKRNDITTIIIGHVTKDGSIAGPRVLEHMVDVVLSFEGDKYKTYRILRGIKNRFGSTNEIGIFNMDENGLNEISNPNELFLSERSKAASAGSTIIMASEGSRVLTAEIQALVGTTAYPAPRRVTNGIDYNRLLQILAVIEKRVGLKFNTSDVYVNITGGIEIDEPAADLGIALAIISCAQDVIVPNDVILLGEIGLSGEIRKINNLEKRISEAQKLGFKKVIIPKNNLTNKNYSLELVEVERITDAIVAAINTK
ncbi:MAG: DNA repair protein RadA [Candidatus Gastranaerophilales bacterium]|nr:DNA repair protein RadA [Candidatus Gastranaerophilales bacterium]